VRVNGVAVVDLSTCRGPCASQRHTARPDKRPYMVVLRVSRLACTRDPVDKHCPHRGCP
jgi:hypothetical protein